MYVKCVRIIQTQKSNFKGKSLPLVVCTLRTYLVFSPFILDFVSATQKGCKSPFRNDMHECEKWPLTICICRISMW